MAEANDNRSLSQQHPAVVRGNVTRTTLIGLIFQEVGVSRKQAAAIVDSIICSMVRALQHGDKVEIRGFGSFRTRLRRARLGHHPKTRAVVKVPAKRVPFFKPSEELRARINRTLQAN